MQQRTSHSTERNRSRPRTLAIAAAFIATLWSAGAAPAQPAKPATFTDGQKVEVREGDAWSGASILKREGRKYLVHYEGADAAADEWVTTDRLRIPGTTGTPADPAAPAAAKPPAATTAPVKPVVLPFNSGDKVEVKWGGLWRKAAVINKRTNKWYLVAYDPGSFREWVEPYRVRKLGSKDDGIGYASPNPTLRAGSTEGPPREDPGIPPEPFGSHAASPEESKAAEELAKRAPVSPTVRDGARELVFGGGDVAPIPADPEPKPTRAPAAQPLVLTGATVDSPDQITDLLFARGDAPIAAVTYASPHSHDNKCLRVERVDLATSRSLGASSIPVPAVACDLSPDGKLLLTHSTGFGFGVSDRLDVWNVEAPDAKHVVSFKPYDNQQHTGRDVHWARFAGPDRVLTINPEGHLVLWDLKAKALWSAQAEPRSTPALSGGGKFLAVPAGATLVVADVQTGKTLKILTAQPLGGAVIAFRPDGKQVAAAAPDLLLVWDLDSGNLRHDLAPAGGTGKQIDWVDDDFVLLDDQYLAGLAQKITVWRYERQNAHSGGAGGQYAGRYWYALPGQGKTKPVLASAVLPDAMIRAASTAVQPDQQMLVRPGIAVTLQVNLPGNVQEKVTAALKAHLEANGVTVADNMPIKLVATTEQGQSREMSYRTMGAPMGGPFAQAPQKAAANDVISRLSFLGEDGGKLWERTSTRSIPSFVSLKKDQAVQDAINEQMQPTANFFEATRLPKFVPKPRTPPGFGASQLTAQGPVAGK